MKLWSRQVVDPTKDMPSTNNTISEPLKASSNITFSHSEVKEIRLADLLAALLCHRLFIKPVTKKYNFRNIDWLLPLLEFASMSLAMFSMLAMLKLAMTIVTASVAIRAWTMSVVAAATTKGCCCTSQHCSYTRTIPWKWYVKHQSQGTDSFK